jgi:aminoacrylate hydrolase
VRARPAKVQAWTDRVLAQPVGPQEGEAALKRTDVIIVHDALPKLAAIAQPTLVVCGDHDACTPQPMSEEIAEQSPARSSSSSPTAGT